MVDCLWLETVSCVTLPLTRKDDAIANDFWCNTAEQVASHTKIDFGLKRLATTVYVVARSVCNLLSLLVFNIDVEVVSAFFVHHQIYASQLCVNYGHQLPNQSPFSNVIAVAGIFLCISVAFLVFLLLLVNSNRFCCSADRLLKPLPNFRSPLSRLSTVQRSDSVWRCCRWLTWSTPQTTALFWRRFPE